jgi:hemolysin III
LKPRLRGWSHAIAGGLAVLTTVALCLRGSDNIATLLSLAVYGVSTMLLYAASATYHLGSWREPHRATFRSIDHGSIYVLIAGTFTPFCVTLLAGAERVTVLALIWGMALTGVCASVFIPSLPRKISVGLYLGMGWMGLIPAPTLAGLLPASALALLLGGGLLYSIGAVVYGCRRPDPFPSTFGFHEIFHLFVIAGNAAFLTVIWFWVAPSAAR